MTYEVRVTRHWEGKNYNVDLIAWERGEGIANGRAFNVTKKEAEKVAAKSARIFGAEIIWKGLSNG